MSDSRVQRLKRHRRVRKTISGSASRPRLAVFRSNRHVYAQLIDDEAGKTVASASTLDAELRGSPGGTPGETAAAVGRLVAERALDQGIRSVVFDRGGYLFHGKVKAVADAAREKGLDF